MASLKHVRNPSCELCPHYKQADTVCMMGRGSRQADIMVVGEAPGAQEDRQGKPFVGPSGQLLEGMLEGVDIDPDDVYFTNVVKCRPVDNDTPKRADVKTCVTAYMGEEWDVVKPKFVLLLGNSALQGVVAKSGITKHRGTVWDARGAQIFATFHPAAVLRNPRYRGLMEADFVRFGRLVRNEKSPTPDTKIMFITNLSKLKGLLRRIIDASYVSYDIETYCDHPQGSNLEEYRGDHSKIVSISFTFEEGTSYVVPLHHESKRFKDPDAVQRAIGKAIHASQGQFIAHNGKFDARWMRVKGMEVEQHFDTMLAAHMLDENRAKGLKPLSQLLLGADAYDVGDDLSNAYTMDLRRLLVYNGKDTDYTLRIANVMRKQLRREPHINKVFKRLMMPASRALVEIEGHGIQLDIDAWERRYEVAQANEAKIRRYMLQFVPKSKRDTFNFASPMQLGAWLFDDLGMEVIEQTKTGAPSTKESVMLQLAKEHKVAKALLKWRKWKKYMTTYFLPWRALRDTDDRIHPTYKLFGTVTGRLSCTDPNLQQVPRDPFIRSVLGARKGWSLVVADYSQVELRIAAMLARETNMIGQFHRGEDIHMNMACRVTGKVPADVSKEERKMAKAVNFGFLYGMGAPKFVDYARDSYDVVVDEEESERMRNGFFSEFPALIKWHDRQRNTAHKFGRVSSPIGRVRHLPDVYSGDRAVVGEAERQAINSPVQSLASDLMLISLIELHGAMDPREAIVVGTVHDSGLFEIRDDVLDKWTKIIKDTMEDMSIVERKFGTQITVPIEADIEVGKHWSEYED